MHVRTFIQKDEKSPLIDVTDEFKQCGFNEKEMLNPWLRNNYDYEYYVDKLKQCNKPQIQKVLARFLKKDDVIPWSSQVIYSWKQTFKANKSDSKFTTRQTFGGWFCCLISRGR